MGEARQKMKEEGATGGGEKSKAHSCRDQVHFKMALNLQAWNQQA